MTFWEETTAETTRKVYAEPTARSCAPQTATVNPICLDSATSALNAFFGVQSGSDLAITGALDGGICAGGSNGGNACTSDAQCPGGGSGLGAQGSGFRVQGSGLRVQGFRGSGVQGFRIKSSGVQGFRGTGRCTTACGGLNIDVLLWTCCRDGENFGGSVSVYYDAVEGDHILAVGAAMESTSVTFGESYDRRNHGTVYLFQQNLCCFNGSTPATSGASCGYPESTSDCADTWGQVKGILSSGRPHQDPVAPTTTCSKIDYNGNMVPWVSPFTENLLQFYCWHTEKISAIDEVMAHRLDAF
eukprot:350244-Rhodomonas_salina.3